MLAFKLAFKNLMGAGLRTWLNVMVLSFAFVVIIFYNGMIDGWNLQARRDTRAWETGAGQLWHLKYDPYDPFSYQDAHALITDEMQTLVKNNMITPVLITQATLYPEGRMMNILMKGIDPQQKILALPADLLEDTSVFCAVIGKRMAQASNLKKGDQVLVRWRDVHGTFDAQLVTIAEVFNCNVPAVDDNILWVSINKLRQITGLPNEATLFVVSGTYKETFVKNWQFKDTKFLLADMDKIIQSKKGGGFVLYGLLLAIALLAIFDTQVLSIFRRQREIGTYIALGMTRVQVVQLFTIEGSAHSLLAILLGAVYGAPLLALIGKAGIPIPQVSDKMGLSIAEKIVPAYSLGLIVTTIVLVIISATIVSYLPARRISKMKPNDALKGKRQ